MATSGSNWTPFAIRSAVTGETHPCQIDVPMLILHGDDDQIVPFADAAVLSAKLVKKSTLKIYPGLPHGMCTTNPEQINADLFAFCKTAANAKAA
jgi:pimeloyl-ACP methyl ester carboxylesterase